jgi:CHAT domain-containing protein/tetratricopeptide (TPR) repeat protein
MSRRDKAQVVKGSEPAAFVYRLFLAALNGALSEQQALEQAGRPELAQASTPTTPRILAAVLACVEQAGERKRTAFFAHLLLSVADALQSAKRLAWALDLYSAVEQVHRRLGREVDLARCQVSRAGVLEEMGRHAEAVWDYDAALPIFAAHDLEVERAGCQMNRANTLQEMGRHAEAVAGYDAVLPVFVRHGLEIEGAGCLMNRANTLGAMGRHAEAVAGYDAAQPIFARHGLEVDVARCLLNRASALQDMGRHAEAVAGYDAALAIFACHGLASELAGCLMNRASALQEMGRLVEAVRGCDAALSLFVRHGPDIDVARCQTNRASALVQMGRHADAEASLRLIRCDRLSPVDQMRYHRIRGVALFHLGRQDEAFAQFEQVRALFRQARRHGGLDERHLEFCASARDMIREPVHLALRGGRVEWAHEAVQDAKASVAGELLLRLATERGREPPRIAVLRKRMTDCLRGHFAQALRDPVPLAEARRAPTAQEQQQTEAAIAEYFRAWQADVIGPAHALGLDGATQGSPAADADSPSVRAAIQRALPNGWALLDFWRYDERELKVFVLTSDRLRVETVPNPWQYEEFRDLAGAWVRAAHFGPGAGFDDGVLDYLDALLLAPLRQRGLFEGIRGLYLVPHDELHLLPLHAARRQDESARVRYLCDDFAISYLPSAALLPQLPPPCWRGRALGLANPEEGTRHTLPFSQWEGWQLQERWPDMQVHIGKAATWREAMPWNDAALVHFSCHGSGHPDFSPLAHLRLADDLLLAHDVLYRLPPLRPGAVVVLNGCETGFRDLRAVDESMGLMTAFLLRGAGLVYATAWPVEDPLAAEMVLAFKGALDQPGGSAAEALRAAYQAGRALTHETVEQRRRELLDKHFPDQTSPHEAAKLMKQGVRYLLAAGRRDEARELGKRCAGVLKRLGEEVEAGAVRRACESEHVTAWDARRYRRPLYWSAFHLVGRVT